MMNPFLASGLFFLGLISCTSGQPNYSISPVQENGPAPTLSGKLVFHRYSCYSCNDSQLYLYDFTTKTLSSLSENWPITNAMNAHFSPNGQQLVFMGMAQGSSNWDVFLYTFNAQTLPANLTSNSLGRDEDPKFSPDGQKIIYKENGIVKEMTLQGTLLSAYSTLPSESSMPYYTTDGSAFLYAAQAPNDTALNIYSYTLATQQVRSLAVAPAVEEYYPITKNATSFLYSRWYSATNPNDQVYLGYFDGSVAKRLPFNESDANFSDAYPISDSLLVISSTKTGGKGGYDLYVVNAVSGKKWSLTNYTPYINSAKEELGSTYFTP